MNARARSLARLALLLSGCLIAALARGQALEIIELKHRTAAEVIPILQPLLEPGGALSGQDYKLFVRASRSNVAQLRQALAQIDRAARQLLVSVRRATQADIERERASGSVAVRGSSGAVSVNERSPNRTGATIHATSGAFSDSRASIASVAVMEGGAALIATGSSIPIVTSVAAGGGRRPWAGSTTSYRNLQSGFLVTPRVNGDLAVLDIEQQDEAARNGRIETQRLATQVSARLGEWVQLGGASESASTSSRGVLTRARQTHADESSIWVRVDVQ